MNHKPCFAIILAIIAGCGGGDSGADFAAVSPSPPAPVPAPAPATPPATPPSVSAPPSTSAPPSVPAPPDAPPPPPAGASVRGEVLIAALSLPSYSGSIGGVAAGGHAGYPSTSTSVEQVAEREDPQALSGRYYFNSAGYMNRDPFIKPRHNLAPARVNGSWAMAGADDSLTFALAEQVQGDTGQASELLSKPGGLVIYAGQDYELDRALGRWTAQTTTAATWDASLEIQSDYSDALFRVCWKLIYPARVRTSCGIFDREQGGLKGVHVVDDSQGMGRLVWRSGNLPTAPAGVNPSVSGEVLVEALSRPRYSDPAGGVAAGRFTGDNVSTATFVEQRVDPDDPQASAGRYLFESAGYMNRDPFTPPRYNLRNAAVTGRWSASGSGVETSFALGELLEGDNGQETLQLPKPGGLAISAAQSYELDQTLAQWTAAAAPIPWDAALQIHSDDVQDWFRVCWQMTYPLVVRQSCGLFSRRDGELVGVHVVDDFEGQGPVVWRSQGTP